MATAPPTPVAHAFIDESGDRGFTRGASDYFVMSAVVVRSHDLVAADGLLADLRAELRRQPRQVLRFKKLLPHHRTAAARRIGGADFLTISSVVVCKWMFDPRRVGWTDEASVYTETLYLLLQRISWYARERCGGLMSYTLAHIIRYKLAHLRALEARMKEQPRAQIDWPYLDPRGGSIDRPAKVQLLQLADLVASATAQAFEPRPGPPAPWYRAGPREGPTDRTYLEALAPRLYRRPPGRLSSYGLKVYPACDDPDLAWVDAL